VQRANADYAATQRDANNAANRAWRVKLLAGERNAVLSARDLFQEPAIANGHCLNQECIDVINKNHETDALKISSKRSNGY
jgi:hypothetical protein